MNNRKLLPKSKISHFALPLLIHYGERQIDKLFDAALVREDDSMITRLLFRYCDYGRDGKPCKRNRMLGAFLRLRDGRMIDVCDIQDAIWDSFNRQTRLVKQFLKDRGEVVEKKPTRLVRKKL